MAGRGTGVPIAFKCWAKRREFYTLDRGIKRDRPRHDCVRTGRTRPTKLGNMPQRKLETTYEYECSCGHVGWSCVSGVELLPLKAA